MKIRKCHSNKEKKAYGLIDRIVNKLPEIHIPGYQYCGPGTDLEKRLARGDPGINKLDQACKDHDIEYQNIKDTKSRRKADKILVNQSLQRIISPDAKLSERAAALLVSSLMGAKIGLTKIGLGLADGKGRMRSKIKKKRKKNSMKKKKTKIISRPRRRRRGVKRQPMRNRSKKTQKSIPFSKLVRSARATIKKNHHQNIDLNDTIRAAIRSAKDVQRNKSVKLPRILKVPKLGGQIPPILPILSALSAIGTISSSAVGVANAIKNIKKIVENTSGGTNGGNGGKKIGRGLYLMRNSKGSGFYLKPFQSTSKYEGPSAK